MVDGLPSLPDPDWTDRELLVHLYTYVASMDNELSGKIGKVDKSLTNHLSEHQKTDRRKRIWWGAFIAILAAAMTFVARAIELIFT